MAVLIKSCFIVLTYLCIAISAHTHAEHLKSFTVEEFYDEKQMPGAMASRLHKRSLGDLGERLFLQFEGIGKKFGMLLESNDDFLPSDSSVRIYRNGTWFEDAVPGRAYVGRRLVVMQDGEGSVRSSLFGSASSSPEDLFAHFYLEKDRQGNIVAQGGFVHEGQFYQVHHESHPKKPRPDANFLRDIGEDRLVISSQPVSEMKSFGEHVHDDGSVKRYQCGHDSMDWNKDEKVFIESFKKSPIASRFNGTMLMEARNQAQKTTEKTYSNGCPVNRKTLLVGVVADCNYVRAFNGNRGKIQTAIINEFSLVSAIYERSFNINLGVVSIDLMDDCDSDDHSWNAMCKPRHMLGEQMSKFSKYREGLRKDVGIYHLVTDCLHTEVVGIAWLNQVCRTNSFTSGKDFVSGTSASTLIKNHFAVIAHEIAHNLGAIHDCNRDVCATCDVSKGDCDCCPCGSKCDCGDKFIMSPGSGTVDVREFSQCSLDWVCKKIPILATCLVKPGSKNTLKLGQCGNGIREDDEECDCGSAEQCEKDPCCQEGCKLREGAQCSDSNDSCCRQCKVIPASEKHVCGKSSGFCQFTSYCLGDRECPPTKIRKNGTPCDEVPSGRCSAGVCTSRDAQCQAIGGQLGIKQSCDTTFNGCEMVCKGSGERCVAFQSTFSDGVACGVNGFCKDGICSESVVVTAVTKYWLAVVVIVGFFLAAILAVALATFSS